MKPLGRVFFSSKYTRKISFQSIMDKLRARPNAQSYKPVIIEFGVIPSVNGQPVTITENIDPTINRAEVLRRLRGKPSDKAPQPQPDRARATDREPKAKRHPNPDAIKRDREPRQYMAEGSDDLNLSERLPHKEPPVDLPVSSYYLNSREIFVPFLNKLFEKIYGPELSDNRTAITCDNLTRTGSEFSLLAHQRLVRDYISLHTPYRGLLLYHSLGAGKSASSIAIAEGLKSSKKIVIMSPASLRRNYYEELKKSGDVLYKKTQHWDWVPAGANDTALSDALGVSVEFIRKKRGVWLVDATKPSNYADLDGKGKQDLDEQLDTMIDNKYDFVAYNDSRLRGKFADWTDNFQKNYFDGKVVIIDEAHNLVSRIVSKIRKSKNISDSKEFSLILYNQLLTARDCRIVLLSGTPIINYPNEIGVMFNILRGIIRTWDIKLETKTQTKMDAALLKRLLRGQVDYLDYSANTQILTVTRNPMGFSGNEKGAVSTIGAMQTDEDVLKAIKAVLERNGITAGSPVTKVFKALPDRFEDFMEQFVEVTDSVRQIKNSGAFQRRIVGLTSYFRSAQEGLLPAYDKAKDYHVLRIPMSDHQFSVYEMARKSEREQEKNTRKNRLKAQAQANDLFKESTSTYRIFSRMFCNFVMPAAHPRPVPIKAKKADAEVVAKGGAQEDEAEVDDDEEEEIGKAEGDAALAKGADEGYEHRLHAATKFLADHADEYLSPTALASYSPKFLRILENLQDEANVGLHLLYSQFRTMEGIGILALVLEQNGFARFKVKHGGNKEWTIDMAPEDAGKPTFAFYTGTESEDERELIRNIYNSSWDLVPNTLADALKTRHTDNRLGEVIKLLLITSSGTEGINLRNTRYVHIMESYWHPVRAEQVIGRARRICSHKDLPQEMQTVEVFVYLMTFTDDQKNGDASIELKQSDKGKLPPHQPLTSDEALFEIATMKEEVNVQLTRAVKETSIDCALYTTHGTNPEGLKCLSFGAPSIDRFAYVPDGSKQQDDSVAEINRETERWEAVEITSPHDGKKYIARKISEGVFRLYNKQAWPVQQLEGTLYTKPGSGELIRFEPYA